MEGTKRKVITIEGVMSNEFFFKLIFYFLAAPFWIAWKILVFAWHFIFKPLNQTIADKHADAQQQQLRAAEERNQEDRNAERHDQLDALKESLPKTLPESMRATIQINAVRVPVYESRRLSRLIADDSFVKAETGETVHFAVDMIIELSETERAIIKEHSLYDLEMEEYSLFSQEQIDKFASEEAERASGFKDAALADMWAETTDQMIKVQKAAKRQVRLGDYLVAPFTRVFPTKHEATQYAQRLKTKLLPQIKELLQQYREYRQTDTIQF